MAKGQGLLPPQSKAQDASSELIDEIADKPTEFFGRQIGAIGRKVIVR